MEPTLVQRLAVPTFLIGLLSLVLGVFAMSQSPINASTAKATTVTYKTVEFYYLEPTAPIYAENACHGGSIANASYNGINPKDVPLQIVNQLSSASLQGLEVNLCMMRLKVAK